MAIINITPNQKTQLTRALQQISLMTHVSVKELETYVKAGQMPDTVRDRLLSVYNVSSLDDIATSTRINSTSRTRKLKTSDVAQIYGEIIKVKEDEAGVTKVALLGAQKTAVNNIIKDLKDYTEDLQQLRDDIEAKSATATTVEEKANLASQKASTTRMINAAVKAQGLLTIAVQNGYIAQDVMDWLFTKPARKAEKGTQLRDALTDFHNAPDKSALPTGNQAHKLINEMGRVMGRGITTTPGGGTTTPGGGTTTPGGGTTTPGGGTTTPGGGTTTPGGGTTTPGGGTTTPGGGTTTPGGGTTTPGGGTTTPGGGTTTPGGGTTTPGGGTTTPGGGTTTPGGGTTTPGGGTTTPGGGTTTPGGGTTTVPKGDIRYKTLRVSRGRKFVNWLGKHWLAITAVVAAGGLAVACCIPGLAPGAIATVTAIGRYALFNPIAVGAGIVGVNVFKHFFFRRHRQAATDQQHLLRREAKVQKAFKSINKNRAKIAELENALTSYMANPRKYKRQIKSARRQLAKLDKKNAKQIKFVSRELEGNDPTANPFKKVVRAAKVVAGRGTMKYYVGRHEKHMDILAKKSKRAKFTDERLTGNLTDEMLHWHMLRRELMEETKQRGVNSTAREGMATSRGLTKVAGWFSKDTVRMGEIVDDIREVQPETTDALGRATDMGELAKDLYSEGVTEADFVRDNKHEVEVIATNATGGVDHSTVTYDGNSAIVTKYFATRKADKADTTKVTGNPTTAADATTRNPGRTPGSDRTL